MYLWRLRSLKNRNGCSWSTCSFLLLTFLRNICKEKVLKFFLCKGIKSSNNLLSEHSRQFTVSPPNQCLFLSSMYLYVLSHFNCSFLPQKYKIFQFTDNGLPWFSGKKKETNSSKKPVPLKCHTKRSNLGVLNYPLEKVIHWLQKELTEIRLHRIMLILRILSFFWRWWSSWERIYSCILTLCLSFYTPINRWCVSI